jgi:adenylate kinase family enzyme
VAKRIVIIGNSGSGKSWLAAALAARCHLPVISLDSIFWLPGGFNAKRKSEEVDRLIDRYRGAGSWIIEGVFGELAARFLDSAELLLWLDLPWSVCRSGLLQRGSESSKQKDPVCAEASFQSLLRWSSGYWSRTDLRSYSGHQSLFRTYEREKFRFSHRSEVDAFLAVIRKPIQPMESGRA